MAHDKLKVPFNEIATLLALDEPLGSSKFSTLLRNAAERCGKEPAVKELRAACENFASEFEEGNGPAIRAEFMAFVESAQSFFDSESGEPFMLDGKPAPDPDLGAAVDPEFFIDFIEKYTTLLDDLEEALNGRQIASRGAGCSETDDKNFNAFIKAYIHTLKGDAGAVGFSGIERACHAIEDTFVTNPPCTLGEPLWAFKDWARQCLTAYAAKRTPERSADKFIAEFKGSLQGSAQAAPTPAAAATATPEDVTNYDLLKELMGEEPEAAPQKSAPAGTQTDGYAISGDPELFAEFAVEAEDHLAQLETVLLERNGAYSDDDINTIFRGIHSIKGASAYFTLKEISESSHLTESLLDEVRNGKRTFDERLKNLLLAYVDLQRKLLEEARNAAGQGRLIKRMPLSAEYIANLSAYSKGEKSAQAEQTKAAETPEAAQAAPAAAKGDREDKLDIKTFVKVETRRLDQLIDSIGEMCIYSSMLIRNCREKFAEDENLVKITHQVEKFSRELQEIGMSMRLIPIRGLFQKMSRLVWDTSKKISKDIVFEMDGEDTELDRSIIDRLADPLMHMVRNAVDHGIETPEERKAAGKRPQGTIKLSAYHRAGNVHIRLEDDGKGLNPDKLVKKAIEKGVLPEGAKLSDAEAFALIFAAGFSTAAKVTDISGRGVGMDVVRRNIEAMRGRVLIESTVGSGTVFTIELPLTLAIIDGIEVLAGEQTFIIPTLSVVEFSKPVTENIHHALDRGEMYKFRGKFLPVFRLARLFQLPQTRELADANFVIAETQAGEVAIAVDEIIGSYSTVIKSLGAQFGVTRGVSGCGILSNGNAALIIDTASLAHLARDERAGTIAIAAAESPTEH